MDYQCIACSKDVKENKVGIKKLTLCDTCIYDKDVKEHVRKVKYSDMPPTGTMFGNELECGIAGILESRIDHVSDIITSEYQNTSKLIADLDMDEGLLIEVMQRIAHHALLMVTMPPFPEERALGDIEYVFNTVKETL